MRKPTHVKLTTFALSTLALASCGKDPTSGSGSTVNANQFLLPLGTIPQLDLVFMIDNSPSMAPKQDKLRAQFPKLIDALKNPGDGALPDLRIAIIDSDLGTGGAYQAGSCGPNDANNYSSYGDQGKFQMLGLSACGVTDPRALWLDYQGGAPVNFTGDIKSVFSCLAGNLGTLGCGFEQQLLSYEFALAAKGLSNESQQTMIRPGAYLGLVFLSDEDDCSASINNGIYGDKPDARGESASLRCATRAHACGGKNLTNAPPGYPTSDAFEAPFASCAARTDACPNPVNSGKGATDTSQPTSCSPLLGVKGIATTLKDLKKYPREQVLVSGIFGWPLSDADMATATYKIGPVPNPNTADTVHPTVFDYLPICYDPNHLPTNPDPATGVDVEALGYGATGGLRMSAFVDEFGANGQKFSICQPDFTAAMSQIGATLSRKMRNQCVPTSYTQAECAANYATPDGAPKAITLCDATESVVPCYSLVSDQNLCPGEAYLVHLNRGIGATEQIPAGTWLVFSCP